MLRWARLGIAATLAAGCKGGTAPTPGAHAILTTASTAAGEPLAKEETAGDAAPPDEIPEPYARLGQPCAAGLGDSGWDQNPWMFCGEDGRVAGFLLPVDIHPPVPHRGVVVRRLDPTDGGGAFASHGSIVRDGSRLSVTLVTCPGCERIMGLQFYGEPARMKPADRAQVRERLHGFVDGFL